MNRRQLFRNSLLGAAATVALEPRAQAIEFPPDHDASKDLARADWKPVFLGNHQNETLMVLSDLIIPETETPGAKSALANRFIDLLLAAESHDTQQGFLNSLAYLDASARTGFGDAFVFLPHTSQVELLRFLAYPNSLQTWGEGHSGEQAGHNHFRNLKDWISRAFYSSEPGMKALGWNGEPMHGELKGCQAGARK